MKLAYTVHSVTTEPTAVTATVDGEQMTVTVPIVVAELVGDDGRNSHTLRLRGSAAERDIVAKKLVPGARVELHLVFPEA